jgi:hypothetical protein
VLARSGADDEDARPSVHGAPFRADRIESHLGYHDAAVTGKVSRGSLRRTNGVCSIA